MAEHPYRAAIRALENPRQAVRGLPTDYIESLAVKLHTALLLGAIEDLSDEDVVEILLALEAAQVESAALIAVWKQRLTAASAFLAALSTIGMRWLPGMWALLVPLALAGAALGVYIQVARLSETEVRLARVKDINAALRTYVTARVKTRTRIRVEPRDALVAGVDEQPVASSAATGKRGTP